MGTALRLQYQAQTQGVSGVSLRLEYAARNGVGCGACLGIGQPSATPARSQQTAWQREQQILRDAQVRQAQRQAENAMSQYPLVSCRARNVASGVSGGGETVIAETQADLDELNRQIAAQIEFQQRVQGFGRGVGAATAAQNQLIGTGISTGANLLLPGSGAILPVLGPVLGVDINNVFGAGNKVGDGGLEKLTMSQLIQLFEQPSLAASYSAGPLSQFMRIRQYMVDVANMTLAQIDDHTRRSEAEYPTLKSVWLKNANVLTRVADQARRDQIAGKVSAYDPFGYMRASIGMAATGGGAGAVPPVTTPTLPPPAQPGPPSYTTQPISYPVTVTEPPKSEGGTPGWVWLAGAGLAVAAFAGGRASKRS